MYRTKILGSGSYFPTKRITNDDLAKTIDTNNEWIVERTGIRARHVAEPGTPTSELAKFASQKALESAGTSPEEIEMILFATGTADYSMPNTACILKEKLGIPIAGALDVTAACSGFLYALSLANSLIKAGHYKKILVVGAETLSTIINWEDRTTCILFGDGAGAFVVGRASDSDQSQIYSSHLYADGNMAEFLITPAGGSAKPATPELIKNKEHLVQMKGKEIFKVAVRMLSDSSNEALKANGFTIDDVNWFVPHQANLRILEAVAKRLNFPLEKTIVTLEEYGNTSAATIPTSFDTAVRDGRIKRGDLVLAAVFGGGLTWGSTLFRY
ncbi:MAG: beta-ketoacyl-ACP synthase III [Bacteriovoracia bacterium]